jgi:hypothetical protein
MFRDRAGRKLQFSSADSVVHKADGHMADEQQQRRDDKPGGF